MQYITQTIQPYLKYLPYFLIAILSSFLLTPIVGHIIRKIGIFDSPIEKGQSDRRQRLKKLKKDLTLRAGGVAVIIPFILLALVTQQIDKQLLAIVFGLTVLTVGGVLDDKYRLGKITQLIPQALAALIIISAGISIDSIQNPFGDPISLRSLVIPFTIMGEGYSFALPADILTFVWILMMIHAVNWIFGVDSLGEGISVIAFLTILFVSVKLGNFETAFLASLIAGSILGFMPFNLYPAKIISGTSGTNNFGFLIAVLSILGGVKVSSAVIVLLIPLLDMLWVMIGRINKHGVQNFKQTIKAITTSDHTHLHHRLIKLGFSPPQVSVIEYIAVGICSIIAFYSADLPKATTISVASVFVLIFFFVISLMLKRKDKASLKQDIVKAKTKDEDEPDKPSEETPESRYAY